MTGRREAEVSAPQGGETAVSALICLLAAALFFSPLLGFKRALYDGDFLSQVYPAWEWLHQRLSQGLSEAWCGGILMGHPLRDEGQIAAYYFPARLIFRFLDAVHGIPVFLALHSFWLAWGTFLLARALKLGIAASSLAALVGAFSGPACNTWIFNDLAALAWAPWAMLGALWMGSGMLFRGAALFGLSCGMACVGGHPALALYSLACSGLLLLFQLDAALKRETPLRLLAGLALAAGIFALLYGGQALSSLRYMLESVRAQGVDAAEASSGVMAPASLLQALDPFLFGNPADNSFLGHGWPGGSWIYQGLIAYVGLLVLALAASGLRDRRSWPFAVALGLLLLYALGPLQKLLHPLPPFSWLRAPMKALSPAGLLLGLAAAFGLESLRGRELKAAAGISLLMLLACALLWALKDYVLAFGTTKLAGRSHAGVQEIFSPDYYVYKMRGWYGGLWRSLGLHGMTALLGSLALLLGLRKPALSALTTGLVLALLFFEYRSVAWGAHPLIGAEIYAQGPRSVAPLKAALKEGGPWRFMGWGWRELLPRAYPHGIRAEDQAGERLLSEPMGHNLSLYYGLDNLRGYTPAGLWRSQALLGAFNDFQPDSDMLSQTRTMLSHRDLLNRAGVRAFVSAVPLSAPGLEMRPGGALPIYLNRQALPLARLTGGSGAVSFISKDDAGWALDTEAPGPRVLYLASAWYPGLWRAVLDGKQAELKVADGIFTSLALPAGRHHVSYFIFDPLERPAFAAVWTGLLLALGCLFLKGKREQSSI